MELRQYILNSAQYYFLLLLILLLAAAACVPADDVRSVDDGSMADDGRTRIVLLHDNDTHFNDNHREAVRAYVESVRGSGATVFLLSAGDMVVRNPDRWPQGEGMEWYRRRGLEMMDWMNELRYDAAASGNHELAALGEDARGVIAGSSATREILEQARFPILAANIRHETPALPDFAPYHILHTEGGLSLAVVGLSVVNFEPSYPLEELDYEETVRSLLHLREEHDALLLLTHIGIRYDLELANAIPELAAIIGGHTNTLLPEAVHVNGVLVAQAGGHAHVRDVEREMFMGTVVLEFEERELVATCGWVVRIGVDGVTPAGRLEQHREGWRAEQPRCPEG